MKKEIHNKQIPWLKELETNCKQCSGLCCTALYFSKIDGFPYDKPAQTPCQHLQRDFLCDIHEQLREKGCQGCRSYDCIGAGNEVTATIYCGKSWRDDVKMQREIFDVFVIVSQLHQMLFYLWEALTNGPESVLQIAIEEKISQLQAIKQQEPKLLRCFDMDKIREEVNPLLKQSWLRQLPSHSNMRKKSFYRLNEKRRKQNLKYEDFSMSFLIGSDYSGSDLYGACFLGSDVRDVKVFDCDLSNCMYLTQAQVNAMQGNKNTKLPWYLKQPNDWK